MYDADGGETLWFDSVIQRVSSPGPQHDASNTEPTVHGPWREFFLFYKTVHETTAQTLSHPIHALRKKKPKIGTHPVKVWATLGHAELSPHH